jgi:hypothetical protein
MKITKHISFYFLENRLIYINRIITSTNEYKYTTDIYIHTNNKNISKDLFVPYTNGTINFVIHDLTNINPYYLTWKCRNLLKERKDDYDIFIYIEDDILVPNNAIEYWLEYHGKLIEKNYNLGFMRIETKNGEEYISDLPKKKKFKNIIKINDINYCVNDINPYCAFWIYDKKEFQRFINSKYYDIKNIPGYSIREKSSIGLNGIQNYWYKNTLIPIIEKKLHKKCKIFHMPNNYVMDPYSKFAKIKFDEAIESSVFENNITE